MGIETAILGAAAIGGISANQQAKAAKKGAEAQADASKQANATELQIYNQNREDMAPYRQAGENALMQLMRLQGFTPTYTNRTIPAEYTKQKRGLFGSAYGMTSPEKTVRDLSFNYTGAGTAPNALASDPGYQFRLIEGQNALMKALAAKGMMNSGAAVKEAMRMNQGYAADEYQNAYNRYAGIAGTGQTATQQTAQYGQNYANQYGQNVGQAANARASAYAAKSQAQSNALSDVMGLGMMYGMKKGWF